MVVDLATAPEVSAEVATPRAPLRFRAARVLLVVLLAAVVTVVVAGMYDDTANALVAGHLRLLIAAFGAGLLVVVALRAPLPGPAVADAGERQDEDAAAWDPEAIEPKATVAGAHTVVSPGASSDEPAATAAPAGPAQPEISPQALLMQVRSLEATLAEEDLRLGRVRREAAKEADDQVRREQRRVRVTMRVMRELVADQSGDAAVARMETALDRLATDTRFARPQLPPVGAGTWPVAFAAPVPLAALTVPVVAAAGAGVAGGAAAGAGTGSAAGADGAVVDVAVAADGAVVSAADAAAPAGVAGSAADVAAAAAGAMAAHAGDADATSHAGAGNGDGDGATATTQTAPPSPDAQTALHAVPESARLAAPAEPAGPARVLPVPPPPAPPAPARKGRRSRRAAGV
jgi:hypothetical protein